jgi:hypothetical protein
MPANIGAAIKQAQVVFRMTTAGGHVPAMVVAAGASPIKPIATFLIRRILPTAPSCEAMFLCHCPFDQL